MVSIIRDNLFNAPNDSIIIHACNTKGVWGSGIAKEFANRFPKEKDIYTNHCKNFGKSLVGTCLLIPSETYTIGCLFTSKGYGSFVDKPEDILKATEKAIIDLIRQNKDNKSMNMCKINSGLFNVPWEETQKVLEKFNHNFTVYEL